MRIPPVARRAPSAGAPAAWAAALLLGGCAGGPADPGAWGFVSLAWVAAVFGAYALGAARAGAREREALQPLRAELRSLQALQTGWRWETDAAGRLTRWQPTQPPGTEGTGGSGPAPDPSATAPAGFGPAWDQALRRQQPFRALRLTLASPLEAAWCWVLSGEPRLDAQGRFCGYSGLALPVDAAETEQAEAAALPALLAQWPGAALWAQATPAGWQVRHLNDAARALWPALGPGAALDALGPALPEPLRAALPASPAQPAQAAAAAGWRIEPGRSARPSLLLCQLAPASPDPAGESEQFSFTVSHDLRAPIRVVEGFTRIVKEDYGRLLDRVANDHLDRVLGAAARMNLMIDALLTLARLSTQPLARQPVNLSQLAAYVMDDLRRGAPEREAEIEIEPGLAAHGDPTLLRMVLENLLGNAWKYSSRCARARISLRSVPHDGGRALVVRDNGAGFDMRSAERLFGLFQRLHSASEFPGHGVGLASVRRIVGRHGGEVWAEAEPGRGAAFYFTLGG
ncbi:MAG: hypothetical protein KGJ24_13935 [Burkholderiales bacterium]|nr:hypothetical protein [Burkholderiales bacterium]